MRYVCRFVINQYGHSGNELPPPIINSFIRCILSEDELEINFRERMKCYGVAIREYLKVKFKSKPKLYSCPDSCDWSISQIGSASEIAQFITKED